MAGYFVLLPDKFVKQLESIPESGMGYHIVDVKLTDGTIRFNRIVKNGNELQLLDHDLIYADQIKEITKSN